MVFNWGFAIFLLLWILVLSIWIVYREFKFRRFFGSTRNPDVRLLFEKVLKSIGDNQEITKNTSVTLSEVKRADLGHIQKIGIVRFNPFRDAGGNQSFALAILNGENSGIVLTGLHARETTRIYVKDVVRGASRTELSKEEKQAVEQAMK